MAVLTIVSAVVNRVAEHSVNAIGRQFGYLWNYRKNMDNLDTQLTTLETKITDMDHSIVVATRNAEEIGQQVSYWLSEAKRISGQARSLIEKRGEIRCLVGRCPNPVSRYQIGRKAWKIEREVAYVITRVQIRQVSFPLVDQDMPILSTQGVLTFDSRKSILEDIIKALQTEPKCLVGLYGFGGMGKTTLAKQVASLAKEDKLFEEIVFASVTQKVDMKEIQGQIASMLDLKLEESTIAERAKRIHQRLKGKKVLVILDDLWDELDLKEVGVPFGPEYMGCKILLTSRYGRVLTSMGTEKDFNLGALEDEEAWRLFKKKAGSVLENSVLHTTGKKVAKRCRGLPVLIVTVAASLSKRPQSHAWNDALNQLKKMNHKGIHDIVNSAIESISYNHLEKTHKRLFVLCGVIGGVASIEEVFQYSLGCDLFDQETGTIQEARDRLHTLILDLKESCLLLDVDERNYIEMHDVVRDVAISIGKKDFNMLSIREYGAELNIWHKVDDLKRCPAMVLRGCPNLPDLPSHLECPSLELFVMSGLSMDSSPSIPQDFFEKTSKLKVLGLSRLSFTAMPPSLSFLKNLQALRLNDCYSLKDISIVRKLKNLQTLSLAGSGIEELPSGIGQLSELRSLDVRDCSELKVIPAGLIKGLTRLEELYVNRWFYNWEAEVCVNGTVKTNASLRELKYLHNLCSLEVRAGDDKFLLEDLHFEKLERYEIIVGDMWEHWNLLGFDDEVPRKFCLQLSSTSINHLQQGVVKRLFEGTECLWLGELKGINNVTPVLDVDGFPNLKHLLIEKDYEIQHVVNVEDRQPMAVFPCLESLCLYRLAKLQKICNGPLMKESFCNLTTVKVYRCYKLESLFSFSMVTGLPRLQEIEACYCDALEAIVAEANINDESDNINDGVCEKIEFANKLRKLTLWSLPNLKNFFSDGGIQIKTQKEELKSSLPLFTKVSFPNLEELELSEISILKYLLTPSVATSLVGLKSLKVKNCEGIKHLVVTEKEGETNIQTINFSQLRSLYLEELPNLTSIYSEIGLDENLDIATQPLFSEKVSFPKLEELEMTGVSSFKYLLSPSVATGLVRLKTLKVRDCAGMKHIVVAEEQGETNIKTINFPQLRSLYLEKLPNLTSIYSEMDMNEKFDTATQPLFSEKVSFPNLEELKLSGISILKYLLTPSIATGLVGLKSLRVEDCAGMKHLVVAEEQGETNIKTINFPQLRSLYLEKLTNLISIYSEMGLDENLDTATQQLFSEKVSFPKLEELAVTGVSSFKYLLSLSVAVRLKTLKVGDCAGMKHLVVAEEEEEINIVTISFPQLNSLDLRKMPNLSAIYSVMCSNDTATQPLISEKVSFPKLEKLILSEIPNLTEIWSNKFQEISCCNLTTLTIGECRSLKHVFPAHVAQFLNKFKYLTVEDCEEVETIIGDDDDEESSRDDNEIIFPNLWRLSLEKLPRLTNFCSSPNYTFNFPKLRRLYVGECPNMKTFCGGITTTPQLKSVIYDYQGRWEGDLNTTVQKVFEEMEAKRLTTTLPSTSLSSTSFSSTSSSDHVEANTNVHENSAEELTEPIPTVVQIRQNATNPEKQSEVSENSIESRKGTETFEEGTVRDTREKGKGKEPEVSEQVMEHSRKTPEITFAGSLASSSKLSSHSEEFQRLSNTLPSTSSNSQLDQEAEIHEKAAEELPETTKEHQICEHVAGELGNKTEISENATLITSNSKVADTCEEGKGKETVFFGETVAQHSATSSSNYIEAAAQVLKNSSNAQNDATNVDKMADTFEKGKRKEHFKTSNETPCHLVPSSHNYTAKEQTIAGSLPAQTSLSHSTELEVQRLPSTVPITWKRTFLILWLLGLFITGSIWVLMSFSDHGESPAACEEAAPILLDHFKLSKNKPHALDSPLSDSDQFQEVQRLPSTVPITSSKNHSEAEAQIHVKSPEKFNEQLKTPKETPCHLVPSSHNYTDKEQTIARYLASSEETNPPAETSLSHSNELEVRGSTSTVESEATDPEKGSEIDEEVLQRVKLADISDKAQEQLHPSKSNTVQVTCQQKDRIHVKSAEKVNDEPTGEIEIGDQELIGEGQVGDAYDKGKGKEYDVAEETEEPRNETSHCLETEPETSTAASSSHRESFRGLRESFQILEAQPMSRVRAEQVRFMEEASEWFRGYVKQAREYMEQKELIFELELKIDDMEAQLQVLKEKKRVAEEKKKAASRVAKFG